jgi:hypothetical protein
MIRIALALLLASSLAYASETARIGSRIVTTGMTTAEVIDRVGMPTMRQDITNRYGAVLGQRWEYHDGRKMVTLWMQTGKVVRIDEQ